ncbi:MAG: hypothetical protein HOP17_11830, partial [Acidobacteria bacterium]|nr:hypothetical protein [Acidobacteriota bacterium]
DRGPINPERLIGGGTWSAYWYNGYIYSSEIARGLDVLELVPTTMLTQAEIDAARLVRVAELNVQNQQRIVWPRNLIVAKAYLDQLERSQTLPADRIAAMRLAIGKAEVSQKDRGKLKNFVPSLRKVSASTKKAAEASRLTALAEILERPA